MHLLNCEHPQRIYNRYIGDYVWTRCGQCNSCRNARAAKWTSRIERERTFHRYSFFVTLTYDNEHLPLINLGTFESVDTDNVKCNFPLFATKDKISISYNTLMSKFCDDDNERALLNGFLKWLGIPYASSSDIINFHKRLNKYIHDNYTQKYQNFRYFVCSEYGSTTLRPHFHGIYFVDDSNIAEHFAECVLHSWQQGRIDCQYVEKSAGSYVAQYTNKFESLPKFYITGEIRQRFFFSRFPTIGTMLKSESEIQESFSRLSLQRVDRKGPNSNQVVLCSNDSAFENRLYPKCFQFKSLSDTCRIKLYTIICRFPAQGVDEFCRMIKQYRLFCSNYKGIDYRECSQYYTMIENIVGDFSCLSVEAYTWLRRVYYVSKRFINNCNRFGLSVFDYYQRIKDYWNKKELFLLSNFYQFQTDYVDKTKDSDSLVLMYPEFCRKTFGDGWLDIVRDMFSSPDVELMLADAKNYSISNRLTHFKNGYLESMTLSDNKPIYKQIKNFVYAKKCNEIA